MKTKITLSVVTCCILGLISAQNAWSQLKGDRLMGGLGLDAGTQAPSNTLSLLVPLYFYDAGSLKNANGNTSIVSPNLNVFITGLGVSYVSNFKILNGTWGATVLLPFIQNRIQSNRVDTKSDFAYTDTYLVPLQLGWKTKSADFNFSYGLYLPTGSYEQGASDNSGLGMLANEFSAGTTLRLDQKGTVSFSSQFSYEIHGDKKGTDIKTGDIFSIEGGLGKSWYHFNGSKVPTSIFKFGAIYYMQFKATNDQIPLASAPIILEPGKDHIYAAGLESNILFTKSRMLLGVRWFDEFGAVNRFQGNTFFITLAHIFTTGKAKE